MRIIVAADHRGYALKETLKSFLAGHGYDIEDVGAYVEDPEDDYVDFAVEGARRLLAAGADARGVFICGSGIGMDVVANKLKGIRAALVHDELEAKQSREHGDSNVIVFGADEMNHERAKQLVLLFLETPFSGEARHARRLQKIADIERQMR